MIDIGIIIKVHVIDGRRVPTQKSVNFMTRSQLDNLHHGQAVRRAVFGRDCSGY